MKIYGFSGLIATEISKMVKPKFTILISSVETRNELSCIIKILGKSKLIELISRKLFNPPNRIAHYMFGAKNKPLLNAILDDTDLNFAKWAIRELLNWKNITQLTNLFKISGTKDKLLPPIGKNTILIDKGQHFMIVDNAKELSDLINEGIKSIHHN